MFVGVFETFIALLGLYASGLNTNYNYHTMEYRYYKNSPYQPPVPSYYTCDSYSGTSVTFEYDVSNRSYLYSSNSLYTAASRYYIYTECGADHQQVGQIDFTLEEDDVLNYSRLKMSYAFDDIFNLNIMVNFVITGTDISINNVFGIQGKYVTAGNPVSEYSSWINSPRPEFFEDLDGNIKITIQTTPINDEEWSGTWEDGYEEGYISGNNEGYNNGYVDGYTEANNVNPTANVIFSGILTIGLMPINFFLGILNFEVFGINIGGLVAGFLTIAITLIIIRIIFSGGAKGGDSK